MKSTFYIAVYTKQKFDPEEYALEAGKVRLAFEGVFTDRDKILTICKNAEIAQCHSEVEVAHDEQGLVGKCVVDVEAPGRVQLDKTKLTSLLKRVADWPGMKIEKRAVNCEHAPEEAL